MKTYIDVHQHLWSLNSPEYAECTLERLLRDNEQHQIKESWISALHPTDPAIGNAVVGEAVRRYPGRFRGMGYLRLGIDSADTVRRCYDEGFWGIKIIYPVIGYDDPAADPIWAMASELHMPVTFHTGEDVLGHVSCNPLFMTPERLVRVASAFPDMVILAAHMGNTRFQSAVALAYRAENVYLDCSGCGDLKRMPRSFFDNTIYWNYVRGKIMFGLDCLSRHFPLMFENLEYFFATNEFTAEERRQVECGTAERLIGQIERLRR